MKIYEDLLNTYIVVDKKEDWQKVLLIYSSYSGININYEWIGPFQYLRIGKSLSHIGWDFFPNRSYVKIKSRLTSYIEIDLNVFLKNY